MATVAVEEEDNNSLLWSNKKEHIRISYGGNDDCVQRNRQIVMDALGNGTLQWSRESKSSSFPLKLHFSLSLVPFDTENSIIKANAKGMEEILNTEFAFVHLYFISVTNFEEYRVSVRSDVSEWFSTLNDANCQHWLIIFDSSRTKDKKSRVQVMDKLKSDFARFNNRLYESSDLSAEKTTSTDPFGSLLQITFFVSLDNYTNLLTANLLRLKGFINENSFSPTSLINEQFRLAHFYRDLGLFEMALNELNSLASFLNDSIRALAQKNDSALNSLNWLQQLRLLPLDKCCTLLSLQMLSKWAPEEWPLVKVQAHLLAHQILLNGQLLSHKLSIANAPAVQTAVQKPSEKPDKAKSAGKATEDPVPEPQLNTLQLRHNSVTAVLGHTQDAFRRLEEDLLILKANYNPVLLHCLFVVWQTEVFELGRHLLAQQHEGVHELLEVGSASTHINFLLSKKCQAIMHLHPVVEAKQSQEFTIARRWLEQTPVSVPASSPVDNISLELLDHFGKFSEVFCSADAAKFAEFAKSQLEEALLAFKHFGWAGHVRWVEQSLTELPKSKVSAESEFKFAMEKLLKLITGQSSRFACDVACELRTTLEKYGSQMEQHGGHRELLFDCCLVMLQLAKAEPEEITKLESRLLELATRIGTEQITRINSRWLPPKPVVPFPVRIARICSPALLHCVLNRPVMFELDLANQLPVSLAECLLTAKFQRISAQNSKSDIPVAENISFRQASISTTTGGGVGGPDSKSNSNGNSSANANATNVVYSLECLLPQKSAIAGDKEPKTEDVSKENASNVEETESASFEVPTDPISLLPGKNRCTFPIVQLNQEVGCFRLHSLLVRCPALHCSFTLDYLHEINRNRLLEHVFCFVDIVKPRVSLVGHECRREESGDATDCDEKNSDGAVELAAGMEQHFWLDLSSGTIAFPEPTNLHISAVNLEKMNLKFKDSTGKWTSEAAVDYKVPALPVGECHRICVPLCLSLDRICPANEDEEMEEIIDHELSVEWSQANEPIFRQFLRLCFRPIMRLRSSTSFLASSAIFILDVCREHQQGTAADVAHFDVIPRLCSLHQEHNIALEPVEARLLNPKPFGPIVANSTFRFVWQLPDSPIGKAVPIPHFLKFAYSIRARKDDGNEKMAEEEGIEGQAEEEEERMIGQQQFLVDKRLDFPVQKVDFEICARFYSEQSQSVLCRIEQPCDLVVSIRSLPKLNEAETVIVSVEPPAAAKGNGEQQLWQCGERLKLTKVKESGIGQAIFTVVPKMLGYLPFPEISIFKYNIADHSPSSNKQHSSLNEKHLGRPLVAFYRNRASQIHILAPLHHSEDSASLGSSTNTAESSEHKKKSLKSQAKDRLQKLFE